MDRDWGALRREEPTSRPAAGGGGRGRSGRGGGGGGRGAGRAGRSTDRPTDRSPQAAPAPAPAVRVLPRAAPAPWAAQAAARAPPPQASAAPPAAAGGGAELFPTLQTAAQQTSLAPPPLPQRQQPQQQRRQQVAQGKRRAAEPAASGRGWERPAQRAEIPIALTNGAAQQGRGQQQKKKGQKQQKQPSQQPASSNMLDLSALLSKPAGGAKGRGGTAAAQVPRQGQAAKKQAAKKGNVQKGGKFGLVANPNAAAGGTVVRRGKEKEGGKKKKFSKVKKIILEDREIKYNQQLAEQGGDGQAGAAPRAVPSAPAPGAGAEQPAADAEGATAAGAAPDGSPAPQAAAEGAPAATAPEGETSRQAAERRLAIPRAPMAPGLVREYCNQVIPQELNEVVTTLLVKLHAFQDRLRQSDPEGLQFKKKRRFVLGMREVRKGCRCRNIKCVVMAPNIEQNELEGGLDSFVRNILDACAEYKDEDGVTIEAVPVVFALSRNKLGRVLGKRSTQSVVGLYNLDGAFEEFKQMLKLATEGRAAYTRRER